MAKAQKTPPDIAKRNKEHASKLGARVRCKVGKAQREFVGEVKGHEGNFALVLFDGDEAATRVYPSICYPEDSGDMVAA